VSFSCPKRCKELDLFSPDKNEWIIFPTSFQWNWVDVGILEEVRKLTLLKIVFDNLISGII